MQTLILASYKPIVRWEACGNEPKVASSTQTCINIMYLIPWVKQQGKVGYLASIVDRAWNIQHKNHTNVNFRSVSFEYMAFVWVCDFKYSLTMVYLR